MQTKIVTRYIRPPIPTTRFDWMAHVEGEDEDGPTGYGSTEADAVRELAEQLADREEQR